MPLATVDGGLDTPGYSWWMFYNPRREVRNSSNPVRERERKRELKLSDKESSFYIETGTISVHGRRW